MLTHQEIICRLVMAAFLGAMVGLERERLEWVAGLRTHMLVCLGSALVMLVSSYGFNDVLSPNRVVLDPSRVAAQVVSGIGFLGAGTILFLRHQVIRGLTTAASLWTVAAVGLAVGGGLYVAAICATVLILVILAVVKPLEKRLFRRGKSRRLTILIDRSESSLFQIEATLEACGLTIQELALKRGESPADDEIDVRFLGNASKQVLMTAISKLRDLQGVRAISF